MRPLPARLPDTDRRPVVRVPQQPYLRVDRNDYSIDPAFAGRRVELRVSQTEVTAVVLDTGELACRHRRVFAGGLTITDPEHQTQLERQRGAPPAARGRGRDPAALPLRRADPGMSKTTSELAHLFRALKAPAAARALPALADRAREEPGAMSGSPRSCSAPRSPPATATAARAGSRPPASRPARRSRSSTSPSSARSRRR